MRILHLLPTLNVTNGGPVTYFRSAQAALRDTSEFSLAAASFDRGRPTGPDHAFVSAQGTAAARLRAFAVWLSQQDYEAVHAHGMFSWPLLAAASICHRRKLPFVVSTHGHLYPWSLAQKPLRKAIYLRLFARRWLQRAAAVVATCEAERQVLAALNPSWTLRIVPPGLALPPAVEAAPAGATPTLRVLYLNRIAPQKGLETLLDGLAVYRARGHDVQLDVLGSGEPAYEARIRRQIAELGLQEQVRLHGFVSGDAKWQLVNNAQVFALSSWMENFSFATAEALAAGLPAVVSPQVALSELVARRHCGLVVQERSAEAWAAALATYRDPARREADAARARLAAHEELSLDAMRQGLMALYRELSRSPR